MGTNKKESIPKNHHYIPRLILRRFVDDGGVLHYFDKRFRERGVLAGNPKNFFSETHLYTLVKQDGAKDVEVEKFFSEIETKIEPILDKIINSVRSTKKPVLDDAERETLYDFMFYQWKRTPERIEVFDDHIDIDEVKAQAISDFETLYRPITDQERQDLEKPETNERLHHGAKIVALKQPGTVIKEALRDKGLGILVIRKPNKSFIIGSMPVLRYVPEGKTIAHSSSELLLPISHDIVVGPAPISPNDTFIVEIEDHHIRHFNKGILKQSRAIAGRSRALIESLTRYY